jgi:hypothetical protein
MPRSHVGAIVECFVAAPDHLTAIKIAAAKVVENGDCFEDIFDGKVHQWDPATLSGYFARKYPELAQHLPPEPEVGEFLKTGGVFFGPYLGFKRET